LLLFLLFTTLHNVDRELTQDGRVDSRAIDKDLASVDGRPTSQDVEQGRLAGTRGAHDGKGLSGIGAAAHTLEDLLLDQGLEHLLDRELLLDAGPADGDAVGGRARRHGRARIVVQGLVRRWLFGGWINGK